MIEDITYRKIGDNGKYENITLSDEQSQTDFMNNNPESRVIMTVLDENNNVSSIESIKNKNLEEFRKVAKNTRYATKEEASQFIAKDDSLSALDDNLIAAYKVLKHYDINPTSKLGELIVGTNAIETRFADTALQSGTGAQGITQITKSTFNDVVKYLKKNGRLEEVKKLANVEDVPDNRLVDNIDNHVLYNAMSLWYYEMNKKRYSDKDFDPAYIWAKYYNTFDGERINPKTGKPYGTITRDNYRQKWDESMSKYGRAFYQRMKYFQDLDEYNASSVSDVEDAKLSVNADGDSGSPIVNDKDIQSEDTIVSEESVEDVAQDAITEEDVQQPTNMDNLLSFADKEFESDLKKANDEANMKVTEATKTSPNNPNVDPSIFNLFVTGQTEEADPAVIRQKAISATMSKIVNTKEYAQEIQTRAANNPLVKKVMDSFREDVSENEYDTEIIEAVNKIAEGLYYRMQNGEEVSELDAESEEIFNEIVSRKGLSEEQVSDLLNIATDMMYFSEEAIRNAQEDVDKEIYDKLGADFYESLVPEDGAEYFLRNAFGNSLVGSMLNSLMTQGYSTEGKELLMSSSMDTKNVQHDLVVPFVSNLASMIIDLPAFNVGGMIGQGALKLGGSALKTLTAANIAAKTSKTFDFATKAKKLSEAARLQNLASKAKVSKVLMNQAFSGRASQIGKFMFGNAVTSGSSFAFHGALMTAVSEQSLENVGSSFAHGLALGASMSFLAPVKNTLPAFIEKSLGKSSQKFISSGWGINGISQTAARVGFITAIESPFFDAASKLIENDLGSWNYADAIKQNSPLFLALGIKHLAGRSKTTKLITLPNEKSVRLNESDFKEMERLLGKKEGTIKSANDIVSNLTPKELNRLFTSNKISYSLNNKY